MKQLIVAVLLAFSLAGTVFAKNDLAADFVTPPDSVRPWVYWFWLDGNISREGITADLEAMKRTGIGGVLIMEVAQGTPRGPVPFAKPEWREMFKFMLSEASRLGIEVNMNNDAGWCGSGGPWITPDVAQKKLVWTEKQLEGGKAYEGPLVHPETVADFYRDIAVVAFPTPGNYTISNLQAKAGMTTDHVTPCTTWPELPKELIIPGSRIMDISTNMDKSGKLIWQVPEGNWTVMRFGYTPSGSQNNPSPDAGRGLECDKLSKEGSQAAFDGLMAKLVADSKLLVPKTMVSTHIDSWEVGAQNWTQNFREEFKKRRGYDPVHYLPVMTGKVVDSLEVSERFLWDIRQTVSDLLVENYAGNFRALANKQGMRLSIEAYGSPCDEMTYAGQADEPMSEFWSWDKFSAAWSCTEMASAAHVYGKKILGAEAFTATDGERWLGHPASIKDLGDWAFCEGINRFVFHRYAMQPWKDVKPGMSMGPWGLHYERTQTWWEQSLAWHEYLARCQYLLQQGLFVADICCLQPEESPLTFNPPGSVRPNSLERPKYNFDGCTPEVVMTRITVKKGRLVLPDGMSYRVLVLPETGAMTPQLLNKIEALVKDGATIIGKPPVKSPSLAGYPKCDEEVQETVKRLWGTFSPASTGERKVGKGRVVWGKSAPEVLADMDIKPDFTANRRIRYIHRVIGDTDVYFIANPEQQAVDTICTFRVDRKTPEVWRPDSGTTQKVLTFDQANGCTCIPLQFEPSGSMFIVFRKGAPRPADHVVSVRRNGLELSFINTNAISVQNRTLTNTFTMVAWVKPDVAVRLVPETNDGAGALGMDRNDVLFAPPGHEVWTEKDSGAGFGAGRNGIGVYEHGANYFSAPLVCEIPVTDWTHVAVVYQDGTPTLYVNGKFAKTGLKSKMTVHSGVGVVHNRNTKAFSGLMAGLQQFEKALSSDEIVKLAQGKPKAGDLGSFTAVDMTSGEIRQNGVYDFVTANDKSRRIEVSSLPDAVEVNGPWEVNFTPGWGAPDKITLDKLMSWSEHSDNGVKYFSGTATYKTAFEFAGLPATVAGVKDYRTYLDLGKVAVMAEVKLNGKTLGILWKPPYRVDITDAVRAGRNDLEVKVVNLWINRMIGDQQLPEDSKRNGDGVTLQEWPQWLQEDKKSPTGRFTFTTHRLWKANDALQESGLLGPVTIQTAVKMSK